MWRIADASRIARLGLFTAALMLNGSAVAATVQQRSIAMHGLQRTYTLYVPDNFASGRRYPIVMLLHGGMGNGQRINRQTGLANFVDRDGFIAVFPDSGGQQWDDGRETTRSDRDDVSFLVALVQELVARFGGDPTRVFVGGASNGGMMVQRLACEVTNVFAAYAVAVANMPRALSGTCQPSRRAPMIFFEGTADPIMPWEGGEVRHGRFRGVGGRVLSVPDTIGFWSRADGCETPKIEDAADQASDGTHVRVHNFGACGLVFYEIHGGGHRWPGKTVPGGLVAEQVLGNSTRAIDATSVMLDFFRRYGL